jgi:hypothetical protein
MNGNLIMTIKDKFKFSVIADSNDYARKLQEVRTTSLIPLFNLVFMDLTIGRAIRGGTA